MSPRSRRVLLAAAALLAAAGAFLAWGPVPSGSGPLRINVSPPGETAVVSRTAAAAITIPLDAGSSGAIIDGVALASSRRYRPPHIIAVRANRDTPGCPGVWATMTGPDGYYAQCAYGGAGTIGPLLGRPIPASSTVQAPRSVHTWPGIGAMIVVGPPEGAVCWTVTSVAFYYHVGLKHYTAAVATDLTGCVTQAAASRLSP